VGALLIAGTLLYLGRRDLTRPAVAFGVPWFAFVAIAQLRLTELEGAWSTGFTLTVLGGGLLFIAAATLAGGTAPARGTTVVSREGIRGRRLVVAAIVLIAAGVAGAAYKAHVLDGIPLLSDDPDAVRGRVYQDGKTVLPAWSSALTGGFYLGLWSALAALWVLRNGLSRGGVAGLWLLAAAALVGVSLEASRNLFVFAVVVPLVAAYLLAGPRRRGASLVWIGVAACVLLVGVGGLFAIRVERAQSSAQAYLEREFNRQPPALRPLVPLYVNAVYPLEAARRVDAAVPERIPYGLGSNSLRSLPDAAFPEGKYGTDVGALMTTGENVRLLWTVSSYQGRLLADAGSRAVLLGSILLGLAFGSLYRWARTRSGLLPLAVIAFLTYYSAFMLYDNQLSFTLIAFFDLAVIGLVSAYCTGRTDAAIGLARTLSRSPST
jgi:hypothetical protein